MQVIKRRIQDLFNNVASGNPTPIVQKNHRFNYMVLGGTTKLRMPFYVFFDNPLLDPMSSLICFPGDVIPVRDYRASKEGGIGREVYIKPVATVAGTGVDLDAQWALETIDLIFLEEGEESAVFLRKYIDGELIKQIDFADTNVDTGTQVIFDSDDIRENNVGACFFALHLEGGGILGAGGTGSGVLATTYPVELRLREYAPGTETFSRVFLFPGNVGHGSLIIPVNRHFHFSNNDGDASRWVLELHNPATRTGVIASARVKGGLYAGIRQESARYALAGRKTGATDVGANGDTNYNAVICATMQAETPAMITYNTAGVAAMNGSLMVYADSLNGGPRLDQVVTIVPAAAASVITTSTVKPRHLVAAYAWAAGGTNLGYHVNASYGHGG